MSVACIIRDATPLDLGGILEIERVSFSDAWTLGMFQSHLNDHVHDPSQIFLVAENEHAILGFALVQMIGPDAELLDIAVAPSQRGTGIGTALLQTLVERCTQQNVTALFLEVRESNTAARTLYEKYHFTLTGRRKRYYHAPVEDALILKTQLPLPSANPVRLQ